MAVLGGEGEHITLADFVMLVGAAGSPGVPEFAGLQKLEVLGAGVEPVDLHVRAVPAISATLRMSSGLGGFGPPVDGGLSCLLAGCR